MNLLSFIGMWLGICLLYYVLKYIWLFVKAKRLGGMLYIHIPFNLDPYNLYVGPFSSSDEREAWVRGYNKPIAAVTQALKFAHDFQLDAEAKRVGFLSVDLNAVNTCTPGEAASIIRRAFAETVMKEALAD